MTPLFYKPFLKISSSQGRPVPAANPLIVAALLAQAVAALTHHSSPRIKMHKRSKL